MHGTTHGGFTLRVKHVAAHAVLAALLFIGLATHGVQAIPEDDDIDRASDCLAETTLSSFSASPSTIDYGDSATLSWKVQIPSDCSVTLKLNGQTVGKIGSKTVSPVVTTSYSLQASMFGLNTSLGSRTVTVENGQCETFLVPAAQVRATVVSIIEAIDAADKRISKRADHHVNVTSAGIDIDVFLKIIIDDFFNPDLTIEARVRLELVDGDIVPSYAHFDSDVDWPWWVTGLTLGVTEFVEWVLEDAIEDTLKPTILEAVKTFIDAKVEEVKDAIREARGLPEDFPLPHKFIAVSTAASGVSATACIDF